MKHVKYKLDVEYELMLVVLVVATEKAARCDHTLMDGCDHTSVK